jgi:hypothetical protein
MAATGTLDGVEDEPRGHSSMTLLREVTAHMREHGVRRVRLARGPLELEVELDPAAQYLGKGDNSEQEATDRARLAEEKRIKGLCVADGCEKKGGHMGQPFCRQHFLAEMNGAQTT